MKNVFKLGVITLGLLLMQVVWGGCGDWYNVDPTCPGGPLYDIRQAISPTNEGGEGCGNGRSYYALRLFAPISRRQFHIACVEHDQCYDTCGNLKEQCDKAFHNRMLGICGRDHNTIIGKPLRGWCNGKADAFYQAVVKLAKDAYIEAQNAACGGRGKFIKNQLSKKCIDVAGTPGRNNGDTLILHDCEFSGTDPYAGSPTDQKWTMNNDNFIINSLSGKCIDVAGIPGLNNGDKLILHDCEFSGTDPYAGSPTDQKWNWE